MVGRLVCAIGFLLACGAVCGAQTAAPAVPAQQASSLLEPVNSPEMDALAAKLAAKLRSDRVTSVIVVGGAGPDKKVSEFGVELRDGLNEALARQSPGVRVFGSEELRALVKQNRVLGSMIYSNAMMYWIASRAHADAVVAIQIDWLKDGRAGVTAQLTSGPDLQAADKHSKANVPDTQMEGRIKLTAEQIESAAHEYRTATGIPAAKAGENGVSMPVCLYCPKPNYSRAGRLAAEFHGTIYLLATVLPDGTADDVMILRPVGLGLDSLAVDTVLKWKFKAAFDSQKRPVATQVPIEIEFRLN